MREILFRGKRKDNGEWVYGYCVVIAKCYYIFTGKLVIAKNATNFEYYAVFPETVGQFTGLTDKNGTKIFEDDILLVNDIQKVYVFFERGQFVVNHYAINLLCARNIESEVIGNIHDNEFEDFENE
jgi:uncharacterized phage protein (TIGR01671 family)